MLSGRRPSFVLDRNDTPCGTVPEQISQERGHIAGKRMLCTPKFEQHRVDLQGYSTESLQRLANEI